MRKAAPDSTRPRQVIHNKALLRTDLAPLGPPLFDALFSRPDGPGPLSISHSKSVFLWGFCIGVAGA